MCGLVGIIGQSAVNQTLYDGLTLIQHRGQDAAGMATSNGKRIFLRKDNGLVKDVFRARHMAQLKGKMGIGHVRYPTAGSDSRAEAQPFYVNSPYGIALGHNGNLTNAKFLERELFLHDRRQLNTASDSEILLNIFANELMSTLEMSKLRAEPKDIFKAVSDLMKRCHGAYAAIAMIIGVGIVAFRDPCGIRPLAYGTRLDRKGESHMFASESVAMDVTGYNLVRDLSPGEVIFIGMDGSVHTAICASETRRTPCIFEYVYLARPDSILDGISVYQTRINMGIRLGHNIKNNWNNHDINVVIPVPDTSRTSALEVAKVLGLPYREGFVKNRYIGRTFIMPGHSERKKSVRQKLNAISSEFKDQNVLLVDDSIVRGTTSRQLVDLAREAGARKVYLASAAPPVRHPNVYGIDMPCRNELVANGRAVEEICNEVGADKLIYQELDDLVMSVKECSTHIDTFDTSCFSGTYVTNDITEEYLDLVNINRNDSSKLAQRNELDFSELTEIQEVVH
ncbi:MAG: amidophosphoribosyltransferase [Gammaproteobacteria bacterium]|nr:amidophosphoribosyltransferase [Gammaproteobacteria bacterium]MCY4219092.1 amidophosphoribosyltransferase [Gammaproteobacteria bacterium]MCY4274602.1 amidophosphoribosyltransferase [Gammaproteobacteria bacterium]